MHDNTVKLSSVVSAPFMIDMAMDPCEHFGTHLDLDIRCERLWMYVMSLDYICYTIKPL